MLRIGLDTLYNNTLEHDTYLKQSKKSKTKQNIRNKHTNNISHTMQMNLKNTLKDNHNTKRNSNATSQTRKTINITRYLIFKTQKHTQTQGN